MKKIIVGFFAIAILISSKEVFASTWNGDSKDCRGLTIVNATTQEGYGDPCWTSTSVSFDAGDTVNVRVYYHNTGSQTARNTKVSLNAPVGSSSNTKTFSASISSDQGDLYLGSVTAKLSSSQNITFNSVKWYTNNTAVTRTNLLNGQSGSEILGDGLFIGDIGAGWQDQGSLVISFHVGNDSSGGNGQMSGNLSASPSNCYISAGNSTCSSTLTWNTSNPVSTSSITKNGSVVATGNNGSKSVSVNYGTSVFYLYNNSIQLSSRSVSASCASGTYWNGSYCVGDNNGGSNYCKINYFEASDSTIDEGEDTKLRWDTDGCDKVRISDIGTVNDSGSKTVEPDEDTTYTLTGYDDYGGTVKSTVKIYVGGDDDEDGDQCKIDSFTVNDSYIDRGDSVDLKWRTTNCDNVSITGLGRVSEDGNEIVYPYTTVSYILRATDGDATKTKSIKVSVDDDSNSFYDYYNANVVTSVATNISQTSATLNGFLTNAGSGSQNVYFEYGTSVDMGRKTSGRTINGNANFSETLSALAPNTIYYFQAVSQNNGGVSRGSIEVFRTSAYNTYTNTNYTNTTTKIVNQGKTVSGSYSPIMLDISNRYQTLNRGEVVDYTVYYKNISRTTLTDPMVLVYIPKGINISKVSAGVYSADDRTLSVPLKDLKPNEEGEIYIQAKAENFDAKLAQIVTTAILVYTNSNGAQENAMAYVLNTPGSESSSLLGASALTGGFLGLSLIGWLLLILIILIIILVSKCYFNKKEPIKEEAK